MKKFIALVVLLCAVMISSTVSATETFDEQTPPNASHYEMKRYFDEVFAGYEPPKKKDDWYSNIMSTPQPIDNVFPTLDTRGKAPIDDSTFLEMSNIINVFVIAVILISAIALLSILFSKTTKYVRLKNNLLADLKNFWIFIFCIVSFVISILYVPYNLVKPNNPAIVFKTAHATIFDIPKDFKPQFTKIDYQTIAFREFLILLGCCAGYTASTIIKKN